MMDALDGHLLLFSAKKLTFNDEGLEVGENRGIWLKIVNFTNLTLAKNRDSRHIIC